MPSAQRIAAFTHREHKSHTVVSAAMMFHDLLKTTLPSRKEFKSCEESAEMWILWSWLVLKVYASCFSSNVVMGTHGIHLLKGIHNLKDQRKCQHYSLLMFFISLLCCDIKISGRVGCNYDQFINVIFKKIRFLFKNAYIGQVKLVSWLIDFELDYVPSAAAGIDYHHMI